MTAPALKVEVAFNAGYSTPAASRTWTDVSTYVLAASGAGIAHGRGDEFSTPNPNTLRLTLDNSDGRFTAGLASGAYFPNVKLSRPIRVTATPSGQAASVRFVGYVDQWPIEWPGVVGSFATCQVSATSRTAHLGAGVELRSIVEEEILRDDPIAYYTLGEAAGATRAADVTGNTQGSLVRTQLGPGGGSLSFGVDGGPETDQLTALQVIPPAAPTAGLYLRAALAGFTDPRNFTFEIFHSTSTTNDSGIICQVLQQGFESDVSTTAGGSFGLSTIGAIPDLAAGWSLVNATVGAITIFQDVTEGVSDGALHHCAVTGDGTTFTMFYDGTAQVDTDTIPAGTWTPATLTVAAMPETAAVSEGIFAHVVLFASELSDARIAAHAEAGLTGFAGETPAARLARYAVYAGVPAAETDFETGDLPNLAHIDTTGKTALACMREVETAEGGVLFDAPDGTLTFHDRSHRYGAASMLTLDVGAGELDPSYAPKLDNFGMLNDVTAATTDGTATARVLDQDSIDTYGPYRQSLELATTNANEPLDRANWLTGNYGEPSTRVPTLTVELAKLTAARQAAVLAVGVGDRITLTNLPDQSDAASKVFYVEGYSERLAGVGGLHTIEFNLSPAAVQDVWILGDATYGVLDSTTRLAY